MTTDEALQFLREHQPLPPTSEISEILIKKYDEVREYFTKNPDNRCISLFLNSFSEGDGHGVFQLVERAILAHPEEIVIPALIESLHNPNRSVREWSAEIAAHYSRPELICPLTNLLRKGGVDERIAAVIALEVIGTTEVKKELEGVL